MNASVTYLIKFCAMFFLILLLIFILAVVTPKLASKIDKLISRIIKPKPERVDDNIYKVKSIYDIPEKNNPDEKNNENGYIENGEE